MPFLPVVTPLWRRLLTMLRLASRPELYLHPSPTTLVSLDPATSTKRVASLSDLISDCPSLSWYCPTPWLASGNLATIWCTLADFSYARLTYSRQLIRVPDGGILALDFAPPVTASDPLDDRPILMVLHGLTGGSHESYVLDVLGRVTKPKAEGGLGWRGCVVNFRGCGGAPIVTPKLYNGGYTDDLRCALSYIAHKTPSAPLYGVGFSLGANVLAKYLCEEGPATPLKTAAVLGCPWDFVEGHVYISSSWLRLVYSRAMASNLRKMLWKHRDVMQDDPRLDWDAIYTNPNQTLFEFDSLVTAPLGGYPTAHAYYRGVSSSTRAHTVAVPLLSISAMDDPIVAGQTVPVRLAAKNPNLAFVTTTHGGHLGWFEGLFRPRRWIGKPVLEWFAACFNADPIPRPHKELVKAGEGWVEKERSDVGFEEVAGGGIIEVNANEVEDGMTKGL